MKLFPTEIILISPTPPIVFCEEVRYDSSALFGLYDDTSGFFGRDSEKIESLLTVTVPLIEYTLLTSLIVLYEIALVSAVEIYPPLSIP